MANIQPLTAEQKLRVDQGEQQFAALCAACHQPHGGGLPNVAPPLGGSEWVTGSPERLARLVLHGLYGPVEVKGERWNLQMPSFGPILDDEQLAAVLTYIRRAWGNAADPVEPGFVAKIRRATESRSLPWSAEELAETFPEAPHPLADNKPPVIRANDRGEFIMPGRLAATYGRELAYRPSLDILAPWRREQDVAEWRVESLRGGACEVWVTLAADDASAGDKFVLETEGSKTGGVVQSSGGYDRFQEYSCGRIVLRPGVNRLILRPDGPLKRELADVRAVRLAPVRPAP